MTEYVYATNDFEFFGVRRYPVLKRTPQRVVVECGSGVQRWKRTFFADECFASPEAAFAAAYALRDTEIAHHESQIARLKAMTFDTVREG